MALSAVPLKQPHFEFDGQTEASFVNPDDLRTVFALSLSHMYKDEVPLYDDLVQIVQSVNKKVLAKGAAANPDSIERLTLERHGAIRLGKPEELHTVRRIFDILGMKPVGYYDLSIAGLPMHATCFRPTDDGSLATNPFRVFTTLLRPELITSATSRDLALGLLARRQIFSDELLHTLDLAENEQGGRLRADQAEVFVRESMRTFGWAPTAAATHAEYQVLQAEHPILADIACFRAAHINHLTPRTLDIAAAQSAMLAAGMAVKDRIEGPPARQCPVLLRQTSFLALNEPVRFRDDSAGAAGHHTARFGEIEERGAAVTPAGRQLYDALLGEAMEAARDGSPEDVDESVRMVFQKYPDTWDELRRQGLVYSRYQCTGKPVPAALRREVEASSGSKGGISSCDEVAVIEHLVVEGILETVPITYEDFLPFSAAGIFRSNLHNSRHGGRTKVLVPRENPEGLEAAMGCKITNPDEIYANAQSQSLNAALRQLKST